MRQIFIVNQFGSAGSQSEIAARYKPSPRSVASSESGSSGDPNVASSPASQQPSAIQTNEVKRGSATDSTNAPTVSSNRDVDSTHPAGATKSLGRPYGLDVSIGASVVVGVSVVISDVVTEGSGCRSSRSRCLRRKQRAEPAGWRSRRRVWERFGEWGEESRRNRRPTPHRP